MAAIVELDASRVPDDQIAALSHFAESIEPSDLKTALLALANSVVEGKDITLLESDAELTPNEVAQHLKMSRTHLYKLLDNGTIPSHRVGRDRRIRLQDVRDFQAQREHDREELANRFANTRATMSGAIDELLADS